MQTLIDGTFPDRSRAARGYVSAINASLFVIGTLLYLACTTGIGLVVSAFVRTQVAGMALTTVLTMLPAVLYSGAMIPVSSLSDDAQIQAHMLPGMYYTRIVDGTFLKGLGWPMLWDGILLLGIYAISLLGLPCKSCCQS